MTRRLPVAMLLVVSVIAVACSSGHESSQSTETTSGVATVGVTVVATGCDPDRLVAPAGLVTVAATDHGGGPGAAFSVLSGDELVGRLDPIAEATERSITLDLAAGTYRTACRSGDTVGGGTLVVGAGSGAPQLGQPTDPGPLIRSATKDAGPVKFLLGMNR